MFQNWKWYNTHILHNYTLQIDFPCLTNVMSNSGREWVPTIITLVLFTIFGQSQQSLTQYNFFFFEGPKLLLNLVSFTCSCSPINFTMEQKGQPQVSKFYQLSRCTSSPFDPKANKEAMWLYAELFLGIWNVQKCQNVQILKLLGVLCRNK